MCNGLRAKDRAARAGEEACFDEQRHDHGVDDLLAVEALHGEALRTAATDMCDEGRERDAEPFLLRLAQRDDRPAAALHEERRLAAEQDDLRPGYPRGPRAGALRPRQRSAVGLRGIRCREHERLCVVALARTELAQP